MSYFEVLVRRLVSSMCVIALCCSASSLAFAQASSASLGLTVSDVSGAVVQDAMAALRNSDTNQLQTSVSNRSGNASFPFLKPGHYSLTVSKDGFSDVTVNSILLNVGDEKHLQLVLKVGAASQSVTVDGSGVTVNTTDGSVSTVINQQFVASIPLNGRSFQDLISMTPGVVTASPQTTNTSPGVGGGDFSINGQRTDQNYYIVDGISANVTSDGINGGGSGPAGIAPATSVLGTTQSLLSVDDLQEFRVESSTYSAEYGRSPGGQLSFVTRSGTNTYHGSAYDYLRNGWFDANDWFNNNVGEAKLALHQNDFGGTLGGPVWIPRLYIGKDSTFFFVSYEGLRLTEPVAATAQYVPDMYMRQQAPAALQPILNAFPLPSTNGIDYGTQQSPSLAQFFQGYSLPGSIDSTSVRIDHTFAPSLSVFFRFADTPSSIDSRYQSVLTTGQMGIQTYTAGATYTFSPSITDELRLGYSSSHSGSSGALDSFGGAVPIDLGQDMGSTTGITGQNLTAEIEFEIPGVGFAYLEPSANVNTRQHQWNLTDSLDVVHGKQHWKFGVDFRPISTLVTPHPEIIFAEYLSLAKILSNTSNLAEYGLYHAPTEAFTQLALYAQDDWRLNSRLTISGGLRWELAPPPHNAAGTQPYTVNGSLSNPSTLSLAPVGTPLWHTAWFSFAPRLGVAWQARMSDNWATVVRAGGGVFFDSSNEIAIPSFIAIGNSILARYSSTPLPLTPAQQNVSITVVPPYTNIYAFPSHLQFPYTLEWNTSVEQQLGPHNSATISYIGSAGRRESAMQEQSLSSFNSSFGTVISDRGVTSDYDAFQAKFQRSISKGVNALVTYSWSHSLDYGSNEAALPLTRGNSDFDLRQSFQGGVTWELPHARVSKELSAVLNGWAMDGRLIARTGYPITLQGNFETDPATGSEYYTNVNIVPDQPFYLYGSKYPGGRSLNPAAFADPTGTNPGNAPRNFVRGFGESQVNFAARREFSFTERMHLQFRAEAFNVFNHPNFGYVDPILTDTTFGQATQMLNQSLSTVASQYQQGGPRSMQFALRLMF